MLRGDERNRSTGSQGLLGTTARDPGVRTGDVGAGAAMVAGGLLKQYQVHYWVIICCHLAMGGGTMVGGWRIIKTMGQRISKLTPFGGFAAETAGALTLFGTARMGIPVSTTNAITGAVVGVGASHRLSAVRWGVTRHIIWAWVLTIPGAGALGAGIYRFLVPLLG